ncbi:MAG: acyltransferase [Polyangiaceae bacterium]
MTPCTLVVEPQQQSRLDHIDGIRACAALVVYLNHAYAQVSTGDVVQLHGPMALSRFSMVAGHLSVTVFIVVSGFCLTLPVIRNGGEVRGGTAEFLKRRARRILPPYYAALALCLLLIWTVIGKPTGSLWDFPIGVTTEAVVSHLLLLQDLFATSRINYVFWSIAVEWQIYFVVPLLVLAWRRYGAAWVVPTALLLGYALRIGLSATRVTRAHPQFLGMFALGMLAAHLARSMDPGFVRARARTPWALIAGLLFVTIIAVTYAWGVRLSEDRFFMLDLPVGLLAMSTLAATSSAKPSGLVKVFAWRPLVFVGTFSYSLYLIHAPLLQILWQYVLVPLHVSREAMLIYLLTLGLGATLVASYGFFRLFEAPFMKPARAKPATQSEAVPPPR